MIVFLKDEDGFTAQVEVNKDRVDCKMQDGKDFVRIYGEETCKDLGKYKILSIMLRNLFQGGFTITNIANVQSRSLRNQEGNTPVGFSSDGDYIGY